MRPSSAEHLVRFSDANGVDRALTARMAASINQAVAAGYGEDELADVVEIFRKKFSGRKTDKNSGSKRNTSPRR